MAQAGLPGSMSPEASAANISLYGTMYDSLVWRNGKNEVTPWAATKWTQVDPLTWRFTLRNDLIFANGDKLTAADVAFTLNLIVQTNMPQRSQVLNMSGAKIVDDYTVDVMTSIPDASVLAGLIYAWIMPKNYYDSVGKSEYAVKPIGSGPYELVSFRSGDAVVFRKRTAEHPFRKVILTDMTVRAIPEHTQMAAGLQTGDLDIIYGLIRPDVVSQISKTNTAAAINYRVTSNLSALISQPEMVMRNTALQDKRVRWAMNYAVDKDAIAKTLYQGYAKPTGQLSNPDSPSWDDTIQPVPYDPAKAKQLLAEAGYPNGLSLPLGFEFSTSVDPNLVLLVQSNLRDVGIDAPAKQYELAAFLDKYYGRNGQIKGDLFMNAVSDTNGFFSQAQGLYSCQNALVWWCNQEFDRNMKLANAEPDIAKRSVLMKKAVRAFYDDVAQINLIIQPTFLISGPKAVGFVWDNTNFYVFDDVYKTE